jgi:hypothetical protein
VLLNCSLRFIFDKGGSATQSADEATVKGQRNDNQLASMTMLLLGSANTHYFASNVAGNNPNCLQCAGFIGALITDLNENSNEWENKTLANYLEGMQSWTEDMEGYYLNNNLEVPQDVNWKVFTDILMAARVYE